MREERIDYEFKGFIFDLVFTWHRSKEYFDEPGGVEYEIKSIHLDGQDAMLLMEPHMDEIEDDILRRLGCIGEK